MLSRILSLLSLLLFFYASNAQEMPAFGTPDLDELNLEACPFDPEAEAVILRHEARSSYNDDYNLMTLHHYRIKVLKDKGSRYADIVIPYYSENDFEYISELEGMVINREPDGTIKSYPLDRKAIFRQPINKYY